ncbi:hypothetical protein SAMN04489747_1385 [Auraticoccus monumenti]|uniref:Uncharacterized protein n=2 Tax=Auraticoccus monumenti TaxID=675864 RepID=A0A1G6W9M6_9ACTN|nr:hypothetical protein SAMN04489747_1385 [Auraticoccus monumenti]
MVGAVAPVLGCAPQGSLFDFSPPTGFKRSRPRAEECFPDSGVVELATAVQGGETARIAELVGSGVDPGSRGLDGVSLWDWALRYRQPGSVRALAVAGTDLELPGWFRRPPLMAAHAEGGVEQVQLLLDLGADIEVVDSTGRTLLLRCVHGGDPTLPLLLARGANLDARDVQGQTPLFAACAVNAFGDALTLLQAGADPTIEDSRGDTFQVLLFGADQDILNERARTEQDAVVAWLEEHGIPVER